MQQLPHILLINRRRVVPKALPSLLALQPGHCHIRVSINFSNRGSRKAAHAVVVHVSKEAASSNGGGEWYPTPASHVEFWIGVAQVLEYYCRGLNTGDT